MAEKKMTFEKAMERLEEILELLESGSESLDSSLKLYGEGVALVRACSDRLENAELSVKAIRVDAEGKVGLEDFGKGGEDAQ